MRSLDRSGSVTVRCPSWCGAARVALTLGFVACVPAILAQPIRRDEYFRHLPQTPPIIGQAQASALVQLYGDTARPGYVDRDPVDGIDDRRARYLLAIAERFSPMLRRNNFLVPRDIQAVIGERPFLKMDTWIDDRRVHADSIVLEPFARGNETAAADADLEALVREFDPERLVAATAPPEGRIVKVLFFDIPGKGERSWRAKWERRGSGGSRIYAHFLVHEDSAALDDRRFLLVVQYLCFYPFNDSGNNHEGDWEHINVHIGTGLCRQYAPK
jgi:hypothetical protein